MKPANYLVELTSCIGMVTFESFGQANAVVERTRRGPNGAKRGAYRCPTCDKWHIGRRSETTKAKRSLRREKFSREEALLDEEEQAEC